MGRLDQNSKDENLKENSRGGGVMLNLLNYNEMTIMQFQITKNVFNINH